MFDPQSMPLEKVIGQLLMPDLRLDERVNERAWVRAVRAGRVTGFILFGGDTFRVSGLMNSLQRRSMFPLWIASDLERGAGQQIRGATLFPAPMALAAGGDLAAIESVAAWTAREARALGIQGVFGPTADLSGGAENPIIGIRSFGDSPAWISACCGAWLKGLQRFGVAGCLKHFPGHGPVSVDSHVDRPVIELQEEELHVHWEPYLRLGKDAPSVMVGHLAIRAITGTIPATASESLLRHLREELGVTGCLITDALNMGGAIAGGDVSAVLKAGMDLALMPRDPEDALASVVRAIQSGQLPEARVRDAAEYVHALKQRSGLPAGSLVDPEQIAEEVGTGAAGTLAEDLWHAGVVALKAEPLDKSATVIRVGRTARYGPDLDPADSGVLRYRDLVDASVEEVVEAIREAEGKVGLLVVDSPRAGYAPYRIPEEVLDALDPARTTLMVAGTPYHVLDFEHAEGIYLSFDDASGSQRAVIAAALRGSAPGRLPIHLSEQWTISINEV